MVYLQLIFVLGSILAIYGHNNDTNTTSSEEEEEDQHGYWYDEKFTRQMQILWLEAVSVIAGTSLCAFCVLVCGVSWKWRDTMFSRLRQRMGVYKDKKIRVFITSKNDVDASALLI